MSDIKKILKQNRPALREVAPLTYATVIGFAIFNLTLALTYPEILGRAPQLQTVAFINIRVWVVVFGIYGFTLLVHLAMNNWKHVKNDLLIGAVIKTAWFTQLLSIAIQSNSRFVAFATVIWGLLLYLKIFTYIFFTPRLGEGR